MSALTLAVPSKGRLKEQTEEFFRDAGYAIAPLGGARGYLARIPALPEIEVRLLSASEIASGVIAGDIHCGISGEDLLREQAGDLERVAHLLAPLGFGRADLVVAAPASWLDVETMADVDDVAARMEVSTGRKLRVATKYVRSTRRFFTEEGVGLPHRGECGRHGGRAGGGCRRSGGGHHHNGGDAEGERAKNSLRRRDPQEPGATRRLDGRRMDGRGTWSAGLAGVSLRDPGRSKLKERLAFTLIQTYYSCDCSDGCSTLQTHYFKS